MFSVKVAWAEEDVELMAMVGSFILHFSLLPIIIGALLGSLVGGGLIIARLKWRGQYIPFGPFLAIQLLYGVALPQVPV